MSRLEQATDEFVFAAVDVQQLLAQVIQDQQVLAAQRRHQLLLLEGDVVPIIQADALKLNRAITNLVVNALNYTPEGGLVQVEARRENDCVVIDVRDNGIGISPEEQGLIFERFYRADKSRSSSTGGTGLGLSITRRIVEAHGGTIHVESMPDKGSLFSIRLPVVEAWASDRSANGARDTS